MAASAARSGSARSARRGVHFGLVDRRGDRIDRQNLVTSRGIVADGDRIGLAVVQDLAGGRLREGDARRESEEKAGGRWYGVDVNGDEDEWGEVLAWDPPARVLLAWRIGADWKYHADLLTEVEARFTDLGDGRTQVDFEHRLLENVGEQAQALREQLNGGWVGILDSFAAVAEGRAPTQSH